MRNKEIKQNCSIRKLIKSKKLPDLKNKTITRTFVEL